MEQPRDRLSSLDKGNLPTVPINGKPPAVNSSIDRLLQAVADCSSALLSGEDFERGVNEALEILGTSVGADRLGIAEQHEDSSGQTLGYATATYEWLCADTTTQFHKLESKHIPDDGIANYYHTLVSGRYWGGLLKNMPEPFRSRQQKLGVKATYAIPILVRKQYWGIIGLDFCRTARELCDGEIAVLKTAATCIGSAIQRERNQTAKQQAERKALLEQQKAIELTKRDCLLNITAKAARILLCNVNLSGAIAEVLAIIGQAIDTDRVSVMKHYDDPSSESLGYVKILFEWHSDRAVSHLDRPGLKRKGYAGIEDWDRRFKQGEVVGGIVEELPEPIRSRQHELGVKSLYAVPIAIEGKYWGVIGFDDCKEAKRRSVTEISILKTTAACIGSAIEQNRIRKEREQAERNVLLEQQKAAQLVEYNRVLQKRDREVQRSYRILAATAEASNILLSEDDFDAAVNKALQTIGQTIDVDRALVIENWHNLSRPSIPHWRILYEWNSSYVTSQISQLELNTGSYEGIEEWYRLLSLGRNLGYRLNEMPEPFRSIKAKIGVKILHIVPIFIENKCWGVIAINDCRKETYRSEAELSILETAAACIGGAIQQERIRRKKEEVERNILLEKERTAIEKTTQLQESNRVLLLRDRWLEATANAANKLLKIADLNTGINAALKVLGESLDCDRMAVMQHFADNGSQSWGFMRCLYGWNSPYVDSQLEHSASNTISHDGLEEWFAQIFNARDYVGGTIDELPQPFRDSQIKLGVRAMYSVPIFVNDNFWGVLSIDYCRDAKHLTLPEIALFKTAASCVGSAIYRQQIQQEKEQAELTILNERNRMAREIHDTLAQAFTGISLQLEVARSILSTQPEAARERLLNVKKLAQEGINEARRSVRALRSQALESGNLITALHQLVDKMVSGTDIESEIGIEGESYPLLPDIEVELYRIAQEASTNTLRHAKASKVCIQLIYETDTIYLQIEDNGIGFDPQSLVREGFGLLGMRERCDRLNGSLAIDSAISRGTKIIAAIPIQSLSNTASISG